MIFIKGDLPFSIFIQIYQGLRRRSYIRVKVERVYKLSYIVDIRIYNIWKIHFRSLVDETVSMFNTIGYLLSFSNIYVIQIRSHYSRLRSDKGIRDRYRWHEPYTTPVGLSFMTADSNSEGWLLLVQYKTIAIL